MSIHEDCIYMSAAGVAAGFYSCTEISKTTDTQGLWMESHWCFVNMAARCNHKALSF